MKKRITAAFLAVILLLGLLPTATFAAASEEEALGEVDIYNGGYTMSYLTINGRVREQVYTYYNHVSPSGQVKEVPAYCVNPNTKGVPQSVEAGESIKYLAKEKASDPKVTGIIASGYPNRGLYELGLDDKYQAYYATKMALWSYLLAHWDINNLKVNPNLTGAELQQAQKVLAAAKDIYRRGTAWTENLAPNVTCVPDRDVAYDVTVNGREYKQQVFTFWSKTWICNYTVNVTFTDPDSVPEGTRIVDMNNQPITAITTEVTGDGYAGQFKVLYPADSIAGESGNVQLSFDTNVYQYAIFYASCAEVDEYGNLQNYMVDTDPTRPMSLSTYSYYSDLPEYELATGLQIVKYETGTTIPLSGAMFEVIAPDGKTVGTYATDSTGKIRVPVSVVGSYTVIERSAPEYYLLGDTTVQTVSVAYGEVAEVVFENAPYGNLRIEKKSDTGMNLPGAMVEVTHIESGVVYRAETNSAGVAVFNKIRPGAYRIRETMAPSGWLLDDTVYTTNVAPGETTALQLVNKELPGLRIIKYDRKNMAAMSDVTFEVWHDGVSIGTFRTDEFGEILLTDVEPGTYRTVEVDTGSDGHILNTTPQEVELKAGDGIRELMFFNDVKPGLRLVKVDSTDPSKVIPNVLFEIKSVSGNYGPEEFRTDEHGEINLSALPAGAYVVTELSCPGYVIDEAQRIIQLDPNEDAQFVFTNSIKPSLQIVKLSSDGTPLEGVAFRISKIEDGTHYLDRTTNQNGEILISDLEPGVYSVQETATVSDHIIDLREYKVELFPGKTGTVVIENQIRPNLYVYKHDADTGEPISDTVFIVRAADGHSVDEIRTGTDGRAELKNLLPGVYEISEKSVPSPYLLDAASQLITLYPNRDHTVYFENHQKPSLTVSKICSVTGEPLKGAKFQVMYASNDTESGELNDLGYFYTDANGQFKISDLKDGWYKITELESVQGYRIKDPATQEVFVKAGESKTVTFENTPLSALVIYKFDSVTGEAVSGAVFQVKYLVGTSGTGGTVVGTYRTSANGSFTVTGLDEGTYIVEELASDSEHVIDTAPQTAYISRKDQDVVQLYFGNSPKGALLIKKINSVSRKPLSDVEFFVTTSDGTVVGNANGKFVTDSAGSVLIEGIDPGTTLIVKETRTRDNTYILDDTPQTARIRAGQTVTLEFRNQPKGNLIINKKDSVTGEPLKGVAFKITYADGTYMDTGSGKPSTNGIYETDANGQIILSHVYGTFIVTEENTIDGYRIDPETRAQTVVVGANDTQTLTFYNIPNGSLQITKVDGITGKPLSGVEFKIAGCSGCEYPEGTYITNKNGIIRLENIPNGHYSVVESSAADGYLPDNTVRTVKVEPGEDKEVTVRNMPLGGLVIKKMDAVTREPLANAVFRVTTADGAAVGTTGGEYRTDESGYISIPEVEPSSLIVTEVKAPDGYLLDDTPKSVEIKDDQTYVLEFFNQPLGNLVITKKDSVTKEPLAGVQFKITYADGRVVDADGGQLSSNGLYQTNENGEIRIAGIVGTVVATEMQTVPGYTIHEETRSQTVVINPNDTQTLTFYNDPHGTLRITKVDSVTKEPLSGVVFRIEGCNGCEYPAAAYTTDSNGVIDLGSVPGGYYAITETKARPGYLADSIIHTVLVESGKDRNITLENEPLGGLLIKKMDAVTREPLANAVFRVTTANGAAVGTTGGEYRTDANGCISIPDVEPSSLIVTEVKAPDGYLLDDTPKTIEVKDSRTYVLEFFNQPLGSLIINKFDSVTKEPLEGVQFKITYADGAVVNSGDGQSSTGGLYVTDKNGQIILTEITGTLVVAETKTVEGYSFDPDVCRQTVVVDPSSAKTLNFYNLPNGSILITKVDSVTGEPLSGVDIKVEGCNGCAYPATIYTTDDQGRIYLERVPSGYYAVSEVKAKTGYLLDPTIQTIEVKAASLRNITVENQPLGSLLIKKMDAATKEPLADAVFRVTTADGTAVGNTNGEYRTDANGCIVISGVKPSSLTVTEVQAPAGYLLDDTPKTMEVKDHQTYVLEFFNQPQGNLVIHKLDSVTKEPLEGVRFKITYADGKVVDTDGGQLSSNGLYETDKNGQISIAGITGTVVVTEVQTIEGYAIHEETRSQTVVINPDDTQTLIFYNDPLGDLLIKKVDSITGKALAGVEFKVVGVSGNEFPAETYTTDSNGCIYLERLPGGRYEIMETKSLLGYLADNTVHTAEVKSGRRTDVTVQNAPLGSLLIKKMDAATKEPLADAIFRVTTVDGTAVGNTNGEYRTDANGCISISNVEPSSLIVTEVQAPAGYLLDDTPKAIEVKDHQTYVLEFFNQPLGGLIIHKLDSVTKEPLEGVQFKITYADGKAVDADGRQLSSNGLYRTDKNGQIRIVGITGTVIVTEVQTIEGYAIHEETRSQTVVINSNDTQTLTFYNDPLGDLLIMKVDSVTGEPLAGVEFKVSGVSGTAFSAKTYTTDGDGCIRLESIPSGRYEITETKCLTGYLPDSTVHTAEVKTGQCAEVTVRNAPLGSLLIKKLDAETKEPLADAVFRVTTADGTAVGNTSGEYRTDKNGYISIPNVKPSSLVVTEVQAPAGYLLDDTPKTVEIKDHQAYVLEFFNQPLGDLVVYKRDSVTGEPLEGVQFKVTYADGRVVDSRKGALSSNGLYWTDKNGRIRITDIVGTVIVTELQTIEGYTIHEETRSQTAVVSTGSTQTLYFYNDPIGGVEIIKVNADKKTERIPNVTFEIRRADDALVDIVTTNKYGRVYCALEDGAYYALEIETAEGFELDNTPHYFEVKDGKTTLLTVSNKALSGILIHKTDSVTGEGIYGATFLLYDGDKTPMGQYVSDQNGWVYITGLTESGRYYIRELENEGYSVDPQMKTVYVSAGKTVEIEWENEPITGQIQIYKYAAEYNAITGTAPGTPLEGAIYEIVNARSGKVVDYISTDARGVAASKALPLDRYQIREVAAPTYWQVSSEVFDVTLEYAGQIVKLSAYNQAVELGVSITKRGNAAVLAGSQMRYDITVANTSNVELESFFWHDRIPTDVARTTMLTTGTYSAWLNYRVLYKTNYSANYQVLASNLITSNNYSFALNAIPMQAGEVITDIYFDFGKVPVGFQSVSNPTLSVMVNGSAINGYSMINRSDVGGKYHGTWQTANANWVTIIRRYGDVPALPKTGY